MMINSFMPSNILSYYKLIVLLETTLVESLKKRPHICGAGWWGTLFLNQFLKKCNPLSVAQIKGKQYTTDSASTVFI